MERCPHGRPPGSGRPDAREKREESACKNRCQALRDMNSEKEEGKTNPTKNTPSEQAGEQASHPLQKGTHDSTPKELDYTPSHRTEEFPIEGTGTNNPDRGDSSSITAKDSTEVESKEDSPLEGTGSSSDTHQGSYDDRGVRGDKESSSHAIGSSEATEWRNYKGCTTEEEETPFEGTGTTSSTGGDVSSSASVSSSRGPLMVSL